MPYTWRAATPTDAPAIRQLARACHRVDGRYAIPLAPDYAQAIASAHLSWCVLDRDRLIAVAWLDERDPDHHLRGYVHPDHVELWTDLLQQAIQHSETHGSHDLYIHSEANTSTIDQLFQRRGLDQIFAEEVMRRDLKLPITEIAFPSEVQLLSWSAETAPLFYDAYVQSFTDRAGFQAPPIDDWIHWTSSEVDFRADLSQVVQYQSRNIGFLTANASATPNEWGERVGWILQVGVHPDWRRHRLASALTTHALRAYQQEKYQYALLHVNINNLSALRMYLYLSFEIVGRRARYYRPIQGTTS